LQCVAVCVAVCCSTCASNSTGPTRSTPAHPWLFDRISKVEYPHMAHRSHEVLCTWNTAVLCLFLFCVNVFEFILLDLNLIWFHFGLILMWFHVLLFDRISKVECPHMAHKSHEVLCTLYRCCCFILCYCIWTYFDGFEFDLNLNWFHVWLFDRISKVECPHMAHRSHEVLCTWNITVFI